MVKKEQEDVKKIQENDVDCDILFFDTDHLSDSKESMEMIGDEGKLAKVKDVPRKGKGEQGKKAPASSKNSAARSKAGSGKKTVAKKTPVKKASHMQKKPPKQVKKSKKKKNGLVIFGIVFSIIVIAYVGVAIFFSNHFYYHTTINGEDFSLKSDRMVEESMRSKVAGYAIHLEEIDGATETIQGDEIDLKYHKGEEIQNALKEQNIFIWPECFFRKRDLEIPVGVEFNHEALENKMKELSCLKQENQIAPENARPVLEGDTVVIKPEVSGKKIDTSVFEKKLVESIEQLQPEMNLKEMGCYIMPTYTTTSKEVQAAKGAMEQYLKAQVIYDFKPNKEVVDKKVIAGWIDIDPQMQVSINRGKVTAYIAELAKKYDTVGITRNFVDVEGRPISIKGGTYGWKMNQEAEVEKLLEAIQNGKVEEREPAYKQKGASRGASDMGNTYVEVNLTTQHCRFVQNGQVRFEEDVVTGKPDDKHATPPGVFVLLEKKKNKVLRGDKKPDGTYTYETPVNYWMRVTWSGIGFHDARWQSSFGGTRFRDGYGSHGCINMTPTGAANLYDLLYVGIPVVIHY